MTSSWPVSSYSVVTVCLTCQSWPRAGMGSFFVCWHLEQVESLEPGTVQVAGVVLVSVQA
ncbi:hypothetical protein [uncultured Oscillibacter sp.]|uniref:hypothetical protein n=1 Tax=uncultured Oscillibacter sp. TaxID=876091 RepID=UPI0026071EEC|nr:hypothetical protein [uncultured Oscillibacter sp.]